MSTIEAVLIKDDGTYEIKEYPQETLGDSLYTDLQFPSTEGTHSMTGIVVIDGLPGLVAWCKSSSVDSYDGDPNALFSSLMITAANAEGMVVDRPFFGNTVLTAQDKDGSHASLTQAQIELVVDLLQNYLRKPDNLTALVAAGEQWKKDADESRRLDS